jgi:predicted glycoside hydrolase/deacetylase ChbG (UPF0249 family)
MLKKIIINADDFGLKTSVNKAIVESFNKGFINSTTLMSNMDSFEEAISVAYKYHFTNRIGIHLNIDEGHLLTSDILSSDLFDRKNHFKLKKNRENLFFLSKHEKQSIYKEFAAQIEKVKKAGINVTHIDTHHHIHEMLPITNIILALLKEYNIPAMRILNNLNGSTRFYKFYYRKIVNKFIKINNVSHSDFFGNQLEVMTCLKMNQTVGDGKKIEIMVHPDYNDSDILVDKIKGREYNFTYAEELVRFNLL